MGRLRAEFTPKFQRDLKKLHKKHFGVSHLEEVIDLIVENSAESQEVLKRRHNMHALQGPWSGNFECHVCNAGDWLLIWLVSENIALMQRTGSHDELFR